MVRSRISPRPCIKGFRHKETKLAHGCCGWRIERKEMETGEPAGNKQLIIEVVPILPTGTIGKKTSAKYCKGHGPLIHHSRLQDAAKVKMWHTTWMQLIMPQAQLAMILIAVDSILVRKSNQSPSGIQHEDDNRNSEEQTLRTQKYCWYSGARYASLFTRKWKPRRN